MERWRHAWRSGIEPQLSLAALTALHAGLRADDPDLLQGACCEPPGFAGTNHTPVQKACAVGYAGWKGDACATVGRCEGYFAEVVLGADARLGASGESRHFVNWFDDTPWPEVRRDLLAETERALERRHGRRLAGKEALHA